MNNPSTGETPGIFWHAQARTVIRVIGAAALAVVAATKIVWSFLLRRRRFNFWAEDAGGPRKVVLVTGASSGLGLAIAKQLIVDSHYFLVLTARSSSVFRFEDEHIASAENLWLRDLDTCDHLQMTRVIAEIDANLGGVDILINNAGVTERSTVEETDEISRQHQLDVNYLAPFDLIAQVLPPMRRKHFGRIINISSAGGFMAMPTMSAYSASKFALEAASESLWYEMKPWGISITLIVPGFINSEGYLNTTLTEKSERGAKDPGSPYFEHYRGMSELIEQSMHRAQATNETIAQKIAEILHLRHPPLRIHITFEAQFFYWIRKILPPRFYLWGVYQFLPNIQRWGRARFRPGRARIAGRHQAPWSSRSDVAAEVLTLVENDAPKGPEPRAARLN
jgi:short-subunit dehydrogenase